MTVDAFYKSASMKLVSNVYSSSAMKVDLDIQGIRLVRLNLQVPNRKLQVFG
ncbi:GSCOCG00005168001-RA-CDS [Cotesia congregata]|nr:GSCOCG00005168001-RA-CDS [Cotesia congregata]